MYTGAQLYRQMNACAGRLGAGGMTTILVVEDDQFVQTSLEHLLRSHGYEVITAANGQEALERIDREAPDLVLTDLRMPRMDGLELLRWAKVRFPHTAVILLTGYSTLESAIQAIRHGADDYLLKPCREKELLERIQAALTRQEVFYRLSQIEENLPAIAALVNATEARDPYTRGHSERVAHYATLLAREVGMPQEEIRTLWLAGLLHDIGKIGVRDAVLYKPGPLNEEEYRRVQNHPILAAQILSPIPGLRKVVPIVLHHHEWYNGNGYPDGLAGEGIPPGARLLAVVDGFEAMTSVRAYRPAFTPEEALERLEQSSGTQYDPCLVQAWVRLVREGRLSPPPGSLTLPGDTD